MRQLFFTLPLLLLMSCNDTIPQEKQQVYRVAGIVVKCKKMKVGYANYSEGYTLTECDNRVKEIINATNIIIYE